MTQLQHIVRFEHGYNCIRFECVNDSKACQPGTDGSHGKHGLNIRFVAKGDAGAVQFVLYTGWTPQYVEPSNIGVRECNWGERTMPIDLGYHSKTAIYEGHTPIDDACEFCDGQPCYYDGSGLNANDAMYALVNGGDAALWAFLDAYYATVFDGADYPTPAEFKKPLRKTG